MIEAAKEEERKRPEKIEREKPAAAAPRIAQAPAVTRVLFIDDSLSVRKVAEKFLKALGTQVVVAVDGVDGLARLREQPFDVVFTDLEMPRMHGYELLREMRYVPEYKDIPVIVVTSRSGEKHRAEAKTLGATDYVTKPFTQEILSDMLKKWVRAR
jgi:chemosensory pili system protein ChpA (sensor histidine kinase/response regulator)